MANIKSAIKRARQNPRLRKHNASQRSRVRTMVKNVLSAVERGDLTAAQTAFVQAQKALDKAAGKGLLHKNKAARGKSRLNAKVKSLALQQPVSDNAA